MDYSLIEGRFYYGNTDGDYFDFEASLEIRGVADLLLLEKQSTQGIRRAGNSLMVQADIALS